MGIHVGKAIMKPEGPFGILSHKYLGNIKLDVKQDANILPLLSCLRIGTMVGSFEG
jgi:hypothetical protein